MPKSTDKIASAENKKCTTNAPTKKVKVNDCKLVSITLPNKGPLGLCLLPYGEGKSVIIDEVKPQSQAEKYGVLAGDIPIYNNSISSIVGGINYISYETFLQRAKNMRPFVFSVLRHTTDKSGSTNQQSINEASYHINQSKMLDEVNIARRSKVDENTVGLDTVGLEHDRITGSKLSSVEQELQLQKDKTSNTSHVIERAIRIALEFDYTDKVGFKDGGVLQKILKCDSDTDTKPYLEKIKVEDEVHKDIVEEIRLRNIQRNEAFEQLSRAKHYDNMSLQQHGGIDQDDLFANPDGSGDSGHDDGRESSIANNNFDIHTKFITTLHRIVSDPSTDNAISWLPGGTVSHSTLCAHC